LKIDDGSLLTGQGRELVAGFLDRFVDERRREGWAVRELAEAFYAFERVSSWGATGPRRAAGTSDLFSPYCTRPFVEYCFSLTPAERYLEAPHRRLLKALAPELLEHRFEQPWRLEHRTLAGLLATRQLWEGARSRRHGVAAAGSADEPEPFLDRWLRSQLVTLHEMAEAAPEVVWQLIDRPRFLAVLRAEPDRTAARDALLRVGTLLWWLAPVTR
jgi:hypothetical protein